MPEFDPTCPHQMENPYPVYAAARAEQPVFFSPQFQMWIVTRYEDICTVVKDPAAFSSSGAASVGGGFPPEVQAVLAEGIPITPSLVDNDPPSHTRFRNLVNKAFTSRQVADLESRVRQVAQELVESFVHEGHADLITRFATPFPGWVIADILGLPREDMPELKRLGDAMVALLGSAHEPLERQLEYARGVVQFTKYLRARVRERAAAPRDDLLSLLVTGRDERDSALSDPELVSMLSQLLNAGHETTTNLIGNALVLLLDRPEQLRALREDPGLIPQAVEESLRMDAPVQGLFRTTTREVELGGVKLPAGTRLHVLYASGNHDESVFPQPERFDLHRPNSDAHLAFSRGIHFCVGAHLARQEGRIALEVLLQRLPNLRYQDGLRPVRRTHFFVRGYEHLPLAWDVG
ncbi:cytochrome P450 [Archangium lipolyticum]|uniref:cytochrome P450 n=1 Tax=Archangium lipolyticum TaxID=2970465 RepID=UPI00214A42C5|nr:cytochrome P450 [Archangium lipolyticum]